MKLNPAQIKRIERAVRLGKMDTNKRTSLKKNLSSELTEPVKARIIQG